MQWASLLPQRHFDAHKGDCGRLAIWAGSESMKGAAILSAKSAFRSGVGYVYILAEDSVAAAVVQAVPEVISLPFSLSSFMQYLELYRFDAVLLGPGLGRDIQKQEAILALLSLLSEKDIPTVVDGDALFALSCDFFAEHEGGCMVLTPHEGEFSRLTGELVLAEFRSQLAQSYARKWGLTMVLKGPATVVSSSQGALYVNDTGNEGMATAGSGDVLAGVIAALLAGGMLPYDAARLGVYVHGLAGDRARDVLGVYSMMASDICEELGAGFQSIEEG